MSEQRPHHENRVSGKHGACDPQGADCDPFGVIEWTISGIYAGSLVQHQGQALHPAAMLGDFPPIDKCGRQSQDNRLAEYDPSNAHAGDNITQKGR